MTNHEVLQLMIRNMRAVDEDEFNETFTALLPYISTDTAMTLAREFEIRYRAARAILN